MFGKRKSLDLQSEMVERGIDCSKSAVECGLGNMACTLYAAVWYGGNCEQCGDFKQGNFIGNFAMEDCREDARVRPIDQELIAVIEAGVEITPI